MKAIAFCGLACCVCSENKGCVGCQDGGCESHGWCKNYNCCKEKGLNGCWECSEFPCTGCMLDKPRIRAFAKFARRYGVEELEKCLLRNKEKGIVYHYEGQLVGDYDKCQTEEEIIEMIKTGNKLFGLPCYCGHDCSKCVTYIATQTNNEDLRRQAQSFYKESFGLDIPLEKFYCNGGRSKNVFELCKECPFKKCCIERGIIVKVGGNGDPNHSAYTHKIVYDYKTLCAAFEKAGFVVDLLEYCDENGTFHYKYWNELDGKIGRSLRFDTRNKDGKLGMVSIIIDAKKPIVIGEK